MAKLNDEIKEILKDSFSVKLLSTSGEDGCPHTVIKLSITDLDDNSLAYMELFESSFSNINMQRNFEDKKRVSVNVFNMKRGIFYQIKGRPTQKIIEGPVWNKFLEETLKILPDAKPVCVWVIEADEIIDENYERRMKEG